MVKPRADLESIEDFLYELGPVNSKDVISFRKVDFEVLKGRDGIEIFLDHPGSMRDLNYFKSGIFKEFTVFCMIFGVPCHPYLLAYIPIL